MIRALLGVALAVLSIGPAFAKDDLRGISLDMSRGFVEAQFSRQCDQLLRSHDMVICFKDLAPSGARNERMTVIFDGQDGAASVELSQMLDMTDQSLAERVANLERDGRDAFLSSAALADLRARTRAL